MGISMVRAESPDLTEKTLDIELQALKQPFGINQSTYLLYLTVYIVYI